MSEPTIRSAAFAVTLLLSACTTPDPCRTLSDEEVQRLYPDASLKDSRVREAIERINGPCVEGTSN